MSNNENVAEMTIRDYFAAKALQAMLSSVEMTAAISVMATEDGSEDKAGKMASTAYDFADAMLRHRIK